MSTIKNKFLNRLFRRIAGIVWDVSSGSVGLKTQDGIFTVSFSEDGTPSLNVNPIADFSVSIPAFATNRALTELNRGDIVVGENEILGWVISATEASVELLDHTGRRKNYVPPKVAIMNHSGVLVVNNLFNLTNGQPGAANLATTLLPLLIAGGDNSKLDDLFPLLLSQALAPQPAAGAEGAAAATNFASNPMLMAMMMGEGKMDIATMAMTGMLGNLCGAPAAGGINPMMLLALRGSGKNGGKGLDLETLVLSGALGGAGAAGGMNPMLLMQLLSQKDSKEEELPVRTTGVRQGRPSLSDDYGYGSKPSLRGF